MHTENIMNNMITGEKPGIWYICDNNENKGFEVLSQAYF